MGEQGLAKHLSLDRDGWTGVSEVPQSRQGWVDRS